MLPRESTPLAGPNLADFLIEATAAVGDLGGRFPSVKNTLSLRSASSSLVSILLFKMS